jgi:hypothetical protein
MNCNYDCDESPSLGSNDCLMKDLTVLICSGVDGLSIFVSLKLNSVITQTINLTKGDSSQS